MAARMPARTPPRTTYLVGRLDRIVRRGLEEALAAHDLTVPQYTALSVLATRPGLSNAQLARRSLVSPQGMNQALAVLAERGWVRRVPHPTNRRILSIELTARGREVMRRCDRAVDAFEEGLLAQLPPAARRALDQALAILADVRSETDPSR